MAETDLVSKGPQPHRAVLGTAHEAMLVVQTVDGLDRVRVSGERLQLDLLEVEARLLVRTSDLMLPVDQPVATEVPERIY